ncbi:hypothetical protein KQX54_018671 [Cotesia glomerata]|uniref:Uncharacterized protein n=1 Tax=Cotesia glomerata TaxID=32391 RepID=A0AAV7IAR2_COTGL|nr:hypothetical protein KQX54_018671 [Cotesia glomerata]
MRGRHTCLEGGNYAASAAEPHATSRVLSTTWHPVPETPLSPFPFGTLLTEKREGHYRCKGYSKGVGAHSIDFVQDSRRRQRRGQPDPPLVVPTWLYNVRKERMGCWETPHSHTRLLFKSAYEYLADKKANHYRRYMLEELELCEDVDDPDKREDTNETNSRDIQACIQLSQYRSLRSFGLLNPSRASGAVTNPRDRWAITSREPEATN